MIAPAPPEFSVAIATQSGKYDLMYEYLISEGYS